MLQRFTIFNQSLSTIKKSKVLINTINAYSYSISQTDSVFQEALMCSDVLIPDGVSVVWATKLLTGKKIKKIAGYDLFLYEMERFKKTGGKCFFLGSNESNLTKIKEKAGREYPNIKIECFSPPYKQKFSIEENKSMIELINMFQPDVLFIGMTAPKQEKWAYQNYHQLNANHICCIGAVFDFYAGTINRAPQWMIKQGLEWLFRLIKEPRRMWKRYLIVNTKFILSIINEKLRQNNSSFSIQ